MKHATPVNKEHERMLAGEWYLADDAELTRLRHEAHLKVHEFNQLGPTDPERSNEILGELLGEFHADNHVAAPIAMDYGAHTFLGNDVFINFGVTILDSAEVHIADRVLIGPNCQLITVGHPVDDVAKRRAYWEQAAPIHIEPDVWLGAGVIVLPGVTIGARSVIGAGSIVTRDIPADCVAVGNPAKVLREINNR